MEDNYITHGEFDATVEKLEAEDHRQNERLKEMSESLKQIGELTASVKELAVNMKAMSQELAKQGTRLETLEARDGEMWRKVASYAVTAVVGVLIGFVLKQIGIF